VGWADAARTGCLQITLTKTKRDVLALATIALAVRLLCIWKVAGGLVSGDSAAYLALARNLAFHHVFGLNDRAGALLPGAQRSPLYPSLIAALWTGEAAPVTVVLVLQAVLGAATVALVYLIARDQFSRTTAMLAGVGMVFARMSCLYTAFILTETLFTFLVTLGVFLWGRQRSVLTGIVFGLAVLTRTTMLPFLLLLCLIPLLPKWRKQWRVYLTISVIALSVTSIWVIRNAVVLGRFIPVQEHGFGQNLLLGTFETKTLWGQIWNGREWTGDQDTHPLTSTGKGLNGMDKERARMDLALNRIANDPLHWLAVRAQQYPRLFMDDSVIYQNEPPLLIFKGILFHLCNLIILVLAVFGAFIERERFASLSHIILFPVFILIVHLPLWIEPRFTLPMMPMVAILAAVGFMHLLERWRARGFS
jgi:4-amino-4-deoxy-L-arabinose transferase-like glycosyltransferase